MSKSKFPFQNNELLHSIYSRNRDPIDWQPIDWQENRTWPATMEITDWYRGRSAMGFNLRDTETGTKYHMFMKDAFDLLVSTRVESGRISGKWTLVKRGGNYGIQAVF